MEFFFFFFFFLFFLIIRQRFKWRLVHAKMAATKESSTRREIFSSVRKNMHVWLLLRNWGWSDTFSLHLVNVEKRLTSQSLFSMSLYILLLPSVFFSPSYIYIYIFFFFKSISLSLNILSVSLSLSLSLSVLPSTLNLFVSLFLFHFIFQPTLSALTREKTNQSAVG